MTILTIALLAIVQGLTEFLPVSSSGHLVMVHALWPYDHGWDAGTEKIFDIAVHIGTLLAVIVVFSAEVKTLISGGVDLMARRTHTPAARLATIMMIASTPVIIAGGFIALSDIALLDSLTLMAWMTLIFGAVLIVVERLPVRHHKTDFANFTFKHAILIGLAQILALIPGVSRSGITMSAARALGHDRITAARFSMLLGVIAISGAGVVGAITAGRMDMLAQIWPGLCIAIALSFITAWLSILVLLKMLQHLSLSIFGIYRLILGTGLLLYLSL